MRRCKTDVNLVDIQSDSEVEEKEETKEEWTEVRTRERKRPNADCKPLTAAFPPKPKGLPKSKSTNHLVPFMDEDIDFGAVGDPQMDYLRRSRRSKQSSESRSRRLAQLGKLP